MYTSRQGVCYRHTRCSPFDHLRYYLHCATCEQIKESASGKAVLLMAIFCSDFPLCWHCFEPHSARVRPPRHDDVRVRLHHARHEHGDVRGVATSKTLLRAHSPGALWWLEQCFNYDVFFSCIKLCTISLCVLMITCKLADWLIAMVTQISDNFRFAIRYIRSPNLAARI